MMKNFWKRLSVFGVVYAGWLASLWGIAEVYTYFTGERLRHLLGSLWVVVFYVLPCVPAVFFAILKRRQGLSREELDRFTLESVDRTPINDIRRPYHNTGLSDRELRDTIRERNSQKKPTFLLRMEYERRLAQRSRE